jgi:hypothetical protein
MSIKAAFRPVKGGGRGGWMGTPVADAPNRINSVNGLTVPQERT